MDISGGQRSLNELRIPTNPKSLYGVNLSQDQEILKERSIESTNKLDLDIMRRKASLQNGREEASDRLKLMKKCMEEIFELKYINEEEGKIYSQGMKERSEKILNLTENVCSIMNIQVKEIKETLSDSALTLYPVQRNQDFINFYTRLMKEICEFPHTFLSKLKILSITVCDHVSLNSSNYLNVLKKKVNSGLFILKSLKTQDDIRDQWYRVIIYHFSKLNPQFYEKWKELFGNTCVKNHMEEMVKTLKCIMKPEEELAIKSFDIKDKISFLKFELSNFDLMIFDEGWSTLKKKQPYLNFYN